MSLLQVDAINTYYGDAHALFDVSLRVAALGVQLVPEERRIIGGLTVDENLTLAGLTAQNAWSNGRAYEMFPRLAERRNNRGRDLSGGEQQMLAIARAPSCANRGSPCSTSRSRDSRH